MGGWRRIAVGIGLLMAPLGTLGSTTVLHSRTTNPPQRSTNRHPVQSAAAPTWSHPLTPAEEQLARCPFPSEPVRRRLAYLLQHPPPGADKEMGTPEPDRNDMGFAAPDRAYWASIPAAAKQIPNDWSRLPLVRFTNSQIGGTREIRLTQNAQFDQWLLNDLAHDVRACISVDRNTRRIYFMQFDRNRKGGWTLKQADDDCYACHASGPRVIRPLVRAGVDSQSLGRFNRLMLSYGACDFGSTVNTPWRGKPLDLPGCASCHDGLQRGRLYQIHLPMIHFKVHDEKAMPPVELAGQEKSS